MARATCPICREPHHRLGRRNVVQALRGAPSALARALRGASARALRRRPARREWSAAEVVGHLLDAEVALAFRVRKLAAEPGAVVVAWDQEKWTDGLRHRRGDARRMLGAFAALRDANVEQVRRLSPVQRQYGGRHPQFGRVRISQLLEHWAEHDLNHLAQLRAAVRVARG
jgi:uncharacterized damage-inducible protein DinB